MLYTNSCAPSWGSQTSISPSLQETSKVVNGGCLRVLQWSNHQRVPHSTQRSRVFKTVSNRKTESWGDPFTNTRLSNWNSTLTPLEVQSVFKDIVLLEPQSQTWNNLQAGLSVGQLSFLIRAGADCLPTPLNLLHRHYRVSNKCPLCSSPTLKKQVGCFNHRVVTTVADKLKRQWLWEVCFGTRK